MASRFRFRTRAGSRVARTPRACPARVVRRVRSQGKAVLTASKDLAGRRVRSPDKVLPTGSKAREVSKVGSRDSRAKAGHKAPSRVSPVAPQVRAARVRVASRVVSRLREASLVATGPAGVALRRVAAAPRRVAAAAPVVAAEPPAVVAADATRSTATPDSSGPGAKGGHRVRSAV